MSRVLTWSGTKFFASRASTLILCVCAKSPQSCPTLCNPMDCSPPGSSVHGDSPGKKTGVSCHVPLQGIFIEPASSMTPALQEDSLLLSHWGYPCLISCLHYLSLVCVCVCVCVCARASMRVCMHACPHIPVHFWTCVKYWQ